MNFQFPPFTKVTTTRQRVNTGAFDWFCLLSSTTQIFFPPNHSLFFSLIPFSEMKPPPWMRTDRSHFYSRTAITPGRHTIVSLRSPGSPPSSLVSKTLLGPGPTPESKIHLSIIHNLGNLSLQRTCRGMVFPPFPPMRPPQPPTRPCYVPHLTPICVFS